MKKNSVYIKFNNYCFAPTLFPSLVVIFLFPLLVYLGFWQIQRGDIKNHIQKIFHQRSLSTPIDLNQDNHIDLKKNYFPAVMRGHFDNQHTFLLENKIYLHQVGYEILSPFILNDRQKTILVNRGWIPQGIDRKKIPKIQSFDKEININGLIVFPNKTFSFNQAMENEWPKRILSINPDFLKKNKFQPFILIINSKQDYGFIPFWKPISLQASRHYAYAFQWFALSLTLLIAFFSTHIRRL
ncbi:SURF1 family protein [Rickettsiella endosymbiont of Miltochrista miniata]|uniref:SURF1 family protein n=1 Tax=Rickettsiella endosymbiont of Miltochrista miniata TaxID=3066239 RepID=UPI00313DBF5E